MFEKIKLKNPTDPFWLISSASVFSYLLITICVKSGFSYGIAILWVVGLIHVFYRSEKGFLRDGRYLLTTYLLYFIVYILINVYHQDILREYDLPLRFLLAIPVIHLLMNVRVSDNSFWGGLFLGSFLGFIWIAETRLNILGVGSAVNLAHHLGNMSVTFGLMSLAGWRWALQSKTHKWLRLSLVISAGLAGIAGSILSGTRGGWISIPLVLTFYLFDVAKHLKWPTSKFLGLSSVSVIIIIILASQSSFIVHRFDRAVIETKMFFSPDSAHKERVEDTSVGERWLMWSNALYMTGKKPLLGWGKRGYLDHKNERILNGEVYPQISKFTDAHNDYIDVLVKKGVFGLAALLSVFLVPMVIFYRNMIDNGANEKAYAVCGFAMIIVFMVSGLTSTLMTINMNVMFYSITVIVLVSLSRKPPSIFVGSSKGHDHTC